LSDMEMEPRERLSPAQRKAALRACDVGPGGLRVLPSRKILSRRLEQSAHARPILSVFDSCPAGQTEFARAIGAVTPSQIRAPSRPKRIQPGRGAFSTTGRVCGRLLAGDGRQHRGQVAGRQDNIDCELGEYLHELSSSNCDASASRTLRVVEDLPSSMHRKSRLLA
jgi:hypothetical protein